ncbi:MAG: hypothetical protein PHX83_05900 [Acidobacteriia bacterium]|nr:hypothetical protein [Terriglobia bacterium]
MSTFFLICFVIGFALTVLSFLAGHLHFHFHFHAPQGGTHSVPMTGVSAAPPHGVSASNDISPINFSTLMAFLTWFGGMGYLLLHYYHFWLMFSLGVAMAAGLAGGAFMFWFMVKVLAPHQAQLDPEDYELVGQLATISIGIREGGTGEIVFSQAGTRHSLGARSADAKALLKGTEVVITRFDHGLAYVQPWEEFADEGGGRAGATTELNS